MGAAARNLLSRICPLFWAIAVALVITYDVDPAIHVLGWVIICTGLGTSGAVSGSITAASRYDKALLLEALLANQPPREEAAPDCQVRDLHAV